MIALFDSGTSRLHFSWWDGTDLKGVTHVIYPESFDLLQPIVTNLLRETIPHTVIVSSVSSMWRKPLFEAIENTVPGKLHIVSSASDLHVNVYYDEPETYGIDRALADYAAYRIFQDSCVVVDAGTGVTVDAIAHDGSVIGGYIFPGRTMMSDTISVKTGLPGVTFDNEFEGIGNSTDKSIKLGLTIGFSAAVNSLISRAVDAVKCDNRIIITGGDAECVIQSLDYQVNHKPHIVLEALGLVANSLPGHI